jgi:hypothetical protein
MSKIDRNHTENKSEQKPEQPHVEDSGAVNAPRTQTETLLLGGVAFTAFVAIWQCIYGHWNEPLTKIFLLACAALGAWAWAGHRLHSGKPAKRAIGSAILTWVVVFVAVGVWHIALPVKTIIVERTILFAARNNELPWFWAEVGTNAIPLRICLGVEMVGVDPQPLNVREWWIEAKTMDKHWLELKTISIPTAETFFLSPNKTNVTVIRWIDGLFVSSIEKAVPPHEPVRGMVFLETTTNVLNPPEFRLCLRTVLGDEIREPIEPGSKGSKRWAIHNPGFSNAGHRDFSHLSWPVFDTPITNRF